MTPFSWKSRRKATCAVRLPALSAVVAVVSAPKDAGLLISVTGGSKLALMPLQCDSARERLRVCC
jgi:hypothetical protein